MPPSDRTVNAVTRAIMEAFGEITFRQGVPVVSASFRAVAIAAIAAMKDSDVYRQGFAAGQASRPTLDERLAGYHELIICEKLEGGEFFVDLRIYDAQFLTVESYEGKGDMRESALTNALESAAREKGGSDATDR